MPRLPGLRHFRADSIVRDLELIREQLAAGKRWSTLGTSYGGFITLTYLLASYDDWTPLYDVERLAVNQVPVAAAIWHDDMYVDAELSLRTAARVGNLTTWITNEWEHDGGSASGGTVLDRLRSLAADLPPVA
jgi:pimeloyl-ACP methyl ester carboxylesterase